jgi:hypothetical protein
VGKTGVLNKNIQLRIIYYDLLIEINFSESILNYNKTIEKERRK